MFYLLFLLARNMDLPGIFDKVYRERICTKISLFSCFRRVFAVFFENFCLLLQLLFPCSLVLSIEVGPQVVTVQLTRLERHVLKPNKSGRSPKKYCFPKSVSISVSQIQLWVQGRKETSLHGLTGSHNSQRLPTSPENLKLRRKMTVCITLMLV